MGRLRRLDLILASASPRRRAILRAAGMSFRVDPSRVDENSREKDPRRLVVSLARRKAPALLPSRAIRWRWPDQAGG
ncbi:MAG: Maf family protein [Elusimicrobia bacterium]|nr:Maf family protein [Elusimicrobiota bacterium]